MAGRYALIFRVILHGAVSGKLRSSIKTVAVLLPRKGRLHWGLSVFARGECSQGVNSCAVDPYCHGTQGNVKAMFWL